MTAPKRQTPPETIARMEELSRAIFRRNPAGCCLIQVDGGNRETRYVEDARARARARGCLECEELAKLMLAVGEQRRAKVLRVGWMANRVCG